MDQRNLFLAIVLSMAILLGFQFFFESPKEQRPENQGQTLVEGSGAREGAQNLPRPGALGVGGADGEPQLAAVAERRVDLRTPSLVGSVNLVGGRIDDVTLAEYRETVDPTSPRVKLLSPSGSDNPYFADFGWVDDAGNSYGTGDTPWQGNAHTLAPDDPLVLTWTSETGLRFERTYAVDDQFMFTVTQRVTNIGDGPVTLFPFGRITRVGTPKTSGFFILHEGPIGVLGGTLDEIKYKDLRKDGTVAFDSRGGWLGFTDKYWLTSLVPAQDAEVKARFSYRSVDGRDHYQTDYLADGATLAPGEKTSVVNRLFVGAKKVQILNQYKKNLGIARFDMAIDFGWFFFLTKPFLQALIFVENLLGNFGLAILTVTIFVKAAFFPLANKSYRAMSKMKALQPKMKELRERFGEDKQRMQKELMELYKREKANPVSGCLPIVLQIPVFFALYKVLFISIEMRQAPFFGWIKDLSVADPTTVANLFGLIPWDPPSLLHLGAWPLIMGVTMFLQQKLNPAPPDPVQARIFMLMPVFFTIFLAKFPAGLVIYWAWNNSLSMLQQYVIMRSMGVAIGGGQVKKA